LFSICDKVKESLKEPPNLEFVAFTKKLLEYGSSDVILPYILQLQYEKELSPSKYKSIKPLYKENQEKGKKGKTFKEVTKIFIAWGRKDGATKKKISDVLSLALSIAPHLIDGIEIENKFSLCSLPSKQALMATRLSKKNKNLPHIHIDEKDEKRKFTHYNKRMKKTSH